MTGKVIEKEGWSHNGRTMHVNLLVIFHSGHCVFNINDCDYEYTKGDIAIVPEGTYYRPHTDDECEYTFFHFNGKCTPCAEGSLDASFFGTSEYMKPFYGIIDKGDTRLLFDYKISTADKLRDIELLLSRCIHPELKKVKRYHVLLSLQFSEMMFYISEAYCEKFESTASVPAALGRILHYIKDNYTQNVTLDDISAKTGLSKQYCMRLFKKYMNATINAYILTLRMRHAAYLLRYTYMNVCQTSDYLGFSSVSYFSRVFKHYYGVAPSEYIP